MVETEGSAINHLSEPSVDESSAAGNDAVGAGSDDINVPSATVADQLLLASTSPRRHELIKLLGVPVKILASRYEEPPPPTELIDVAEYVQFLAANKALEVASRHPHNFVVGADTLVTLSPTDRGRPLGKPADINDARRMLGLLSGRTHWVYTGIAVCMFDHGEVVRVTAYERTGVSFRTLTPRMIEDYLETGESMDKAGAYGAQGRAAPFIEGFQGDYFNVVGLPLCALGILLESTGFVWPRHK